MEEKAAGIRWDSAVKVQRIPGAEWWEMRLGLLVRDPQGSSQKC